MAVEGTRKGEEEKLSAALHQLVEEDPSIIVEVSAELKQTIIHCQGELHMSVIKWKLENTHKLSVDFKKPKVAYRETIQTEAETTYRHKKQSGGAGQFGEISMKIFPITAESEEPKGYPIRGKEEIELPWGGKLIYYNCIVGGAIDARFHPSILKGVMEKMQEGPLTGSNVQDVGVLVYDGKMHAVDSNDLSFKIAGMMAFKENFVNANPQLLEPIYTVTIVTPDDITGSVMSAIQSHRSIVEGMDAEGHFTKIKALIPIAEMHNFMEAVRSLSQGRAKLSMEFSHYEKVPYEIQQLLIHSFKDELQEV